MPWKRSWIPRSSSCRQLWTLRQAAGNQALVLCKENATGPSKRFLISVSLVGDFAPTVGWVINILPEKWVCRLWEGHKIGSSLWPSPSLQQQVMKPGKKALVSLYYCPGDPRVEVFILHLEEEALISKDTERNLNKAASKFSILRQCPSTAIPSFFKLSIKTCGFVYAVGLWFSCEGVGVAFYVMSVCLIFSRYCDSDTGASDASQTMREGYHSLPCSIQLHVQSLKASLVHTKKKLK